MTYLTLVNLRTSKDGSSKRTFKTKDGQTLEVGHPVNGSKKDIQVVPTHTGCNLGCAFCSLTKCSNTKAPRKLQAVEVIEALDRSYVPYHPTRLISFMGAGEPLLNLEAVVEVFKHFPGARHTIASMIPTLKTFVDFERETEGLDVKLHWSLHSTETRVRKALMPNAESTTVILRHILERAEKHPVEVHYTLIRDVNDGLQDVAALIDWFYGTQVTVRLLKLSPCSLQASGSEEWFLNILTSHGVKAESYCPPGLDIGASCGMFDEKLYENA